MKIHVQTPCIYIRNGLLCARGWAFDIIPCIGISSMRFKRLSSKFLFFHFCFYDFDVKRECKHYPSTQNNYTTHTIPFRFGMLQMPISMYGTRVKETTTTKVVMNDIIYWIMLLIFFSSPKDFHITHLPSVRCLFFCQLSSDFKFIVVWQPNIFWENFTYFCLETALLPDKNHKLMNKQNKWKIKFNFFFLVAVALDPKYL